MGVRFHLSEDKSPTLFRFHVGNSALCKLESSDEQAEEFGFLGRKEIEGFGNGRKGIACFLPSQVTF